MKTIKEFVTDRIANHVESDLEIQARAHKRFPLNAVTLGYIQRIRRERERQRAVATYEVLPMHSDLHLGVAPVRFDCANGEQMTVACEDARECAADLAVELNISFEVWLCRGGVDMVVDTRLAGPQGVHPYTTEERSRA